MWWTLKLFGLIDGTNLTKISHPNMTHFHYGVTFDDATTSNVLIV
jgi:hypothetical protein